MYNRKENIVKKRLLMVGLIICFVFLLPVSAGAAVQNSNVSVTEEYWLMDNSGYMNSRTKNT